MDHVIDHTHWDNLCHDLRTPLSAILGISHLLMTPRCPPDTQRECAAALRDSATQLKALVDDMLDYARLGAKKMELTCIPFNPAETIREAARIVTIEARNKGLDFRLKLSQLPARLMGDPLRLRQIILNLLGNAVKFTSHGYIALEASAEPLGIGFYKLTIRVSDSGKGIAADKLERIFDRFTQADHTVAELHGGSGLGLAICHELAQLMHGNLEVKSMPGQGSCFTVTLRLSDQQFRTA